MKQTLDWMLMLASLMVGYSRRSSILPRKLNSVTIWSLVAWGAMLVTWMTRESDSMVTTVSCHSWLVIFVSEITFHVKYKH